MRWLVLTDDHLPTPGGVAVWTDRVVEGLRAAGHDAVVYARWRRDLPSGVHGVRWPSFGMHGGEGLGLASLGEPYDRVLCTTWTVVPPRWRNVDVVLHGSDVTRPCRRASRRLRVLLRNRVWSVSKALADVAAPWGVSARVLPAPVAIAPFPARPVGDPTWVWVGRMAPGKGAHRFVDMVAAAGVRGRMIGDGLLRRDLEKRSEHAGAMIEFLGWQPGDRVRTLVADCHVLVSLPEPAGQAHGAEGFGMVAAEAAALGVPVVGCCVGGLPEAVGPGLLLDHPDDVAGSVDAIRAWWNPGRGREAWNFVRARHGTTRTVGALARG